MPWIDPEDDAALIATVWPSAPDDVDGVLTLYLDAAKEACVAFAPALAEAATLPASARLAQLMQASNTYNAALAAPGGEADAGGFGLTMHPLDWQIKQLLRPRRAVGALV